MYTQGSATHLGGLLLSSQSAQAFAITEQQQTQACTELDKRSYASLQIALATNGLGLWNWNLVTDRTYYNAQWKQILGYEVEEIENQHKSFEQLVHPEDLPRVITALNDYLEGRIPVYEAEFRMMTKSGEWKWILDRGKVFQWDESGKPVQMVGTHQDITKQKQQEQALQQSAIQQRQLFEQLQTEVASRLFTEAQEQKTAQQLKDTQDELRDVQEQLLHNEKMANLGQLLANVADEIYNPINFINASVHSANQYADELVHLLELYQYYYPTPKAEIGEELQRLDLDFMKTDFLKLLWSMRSGSERIKEIVFALWNFSQGKDSQMTKADIHTGLDSVLRILQHRLKEQPDRPPIQVIKEFGELPLVECYVSELNQVFMNILMNAIDALEERTNQDVSLVPKIWIRTEVVSSHLSLVDSHSKQPSKLQKIVIRISDNGKGILPHIQRQIFEPFFTTKLEGKAKGLGLSISEQIIVKKHKGKLRCNSRLGQGTEFVIELSTKKTRYADIIKHASY